MASLRDIQAALEAKQGAPKTPLTKAAEVVDRRTRPVLAGLLKALEANQNS